MKDELSQEQIDQILGAFEETLTTGPWEKSNFLRAIGNNLRAIRDKFATMSGTEVRAHQSQQDMINKVAMRAGQQEIYVALYNTDGGNIHAWERLIANLPKQIISRPIYADEADIKYLMKSKLQPNTDGYVAVYINPNLILNVHPDKLPKDKFGKPMLSLKDRAIELDNVTRFVHSSGVYRYIQGRLLK